MEINLLLFALMGGVVSADTEAAGQFMIAQPLVACSLAGLIFGNPGLGLTVGLLLQLPYLAEIPTGGKKMSLGNLGAFVAAGMALNLTPVFPDQANLILFASIFWGVGLSWLTPPLLKWDRRLNLLLIRQAEKAARGGKIGKITLLNSLGVANAFTFGVLYALVFLFSGQFIVEHMMTKVSLNLRQLFDLVQPVLFGAGLGAILYIFINRKSARFAAIGAAVGLIFLFFKTFV